MKAKLFFIIFSALLFYKVSAQNYVTIYSDCNYGGKSQTLETGWFKTNQLGIGNDALSSIKIPGGWSVTIYSDDNFKGASKLISGNINCVSNDWNDKVSSIWVRNTNINGGGGNNNDQVTIYADCNYGGASQVFKVGWFNTDELGIGNDALSSIKIPTGWSITIYDDNDFSGASKFLTNSTNCISNDWNDRVSSISISNGRNNDDEVIIYADCSFKGSSQRFSGGWYNVDQLGIGNDALSSIKIPRGWSVTFYEDAEFKGRSQVFTSAVYCIDSDWNDKVSSIRIRKN